MESDEGDALDEDEVPVVSSARFFPLILLINWTIWAGECNILELKSTGLGSRHFGNQARSLFRSFFLMQNARPSVKICVTEAGLYYLEAYGSR